MNISELFIRRPIATSLLAAAVLIGGILSFLSLPISALPQVDFPTIQITTQLPGANPHATESLLTAPLERQLGQIPSLASMTSTSSFGLSQITLQFELNRDIDAAAQDVQAAINAAGATLPHNLPYPPIYSKANPADAPILTLAMISPTISIREMSDIADTILVQRLSQISGVGRVRLQGGVKPAVRIQADLSRLAAYGLGLEDIRNAVSQANVNGPKGYIDGPAQSYTITANDQLDAAAAYRTVTLATSNNAPVMIQDVAEVLNGLENDRVAGYYKGQPAIIIDILRQPGANVVETVRLIQKELPHLEATMPKDVQVIEVNDRTTTIKASIFDVEITLLTSVILVVLVVFVFLRSSRATIVAGVALPLSLIGTFATMGLMGFSLDNLSLMALTIGTGFVVDDAIVMIENIARHIETGQKPFDAALQGAREIGFTIVSLTVSLIAVFIPLLFMSGIVGRMFQEFALTLTIAVVVSAVVSLTLTPMMCAWLFKPNQLETPEAKKKSHHLIAVLLQSYRKSLDLTLNFPGVTLIGLMLTLAITLFLYFYIPKGFLPSQDTGVITAVGLSDANVSFDELRRRQQNVAQAIAQDPDVASVSDSIGVGAINTTPNAGYLTIVLKPRDQRQLSAAQIIQNLHKRTKMVPGIALTFQAVQDVQISTRASRSRYQYTLMGTKADELSHWSQELTRQLQRDPRLSDVGSESQDGGAQLAIHVDRTMAGRLGVSMQNVSDTLNDAFGQRQISTIYAQTNQYRVILEAAPRFQADPNSLHQLYVSGTNNVQTPIAAFTKVENKTVPLVIGHQEQFPSATLSFNTAPGASLGDAIDAVDQASKAIGMPASVLGSFTGDALEFEHALAGEPLLILAALITIYIVLGVLYENAIHPITILSTLPSAGVGALLALILLQMDLSLIALIGIILLMGIVKKNAIMMIDFALDAERIQGMAPRQAILEAAVLRFRPIMMTTLAALFGALPLVINHGTGSELRIPLGVTIIGGLLLSQLLTLYSTPVIYLSFENWRYRLFGAMQRIDADAGEKNSGATPGS